jgi:hypothetical membrane protein
MSFLLVGPSGWTQNKLWFLGSGLALLSAAVLNLVGRKVPGRTLSGLAVVGINLCLVGFFAAAWPVLKGPQVLVGGALFFALAGVAISRERPE